MIQPLDLWPHHSQPALCTAAPATPPPFSLTPRCALHGEMLPADPPGAALFRCGSDGPGEPWQPPSPEWLFLLTFPPHSTPCPSHTCLFACLLAFGPWPLLGPVNAGSRRAGLAWFTHCHDPAPARVQMQRALCKWSQHGRRTERARSEEPAVSRHLPGTGCSGRCSLTLPLCPRCCRRAPDIGPSNRVTHPARQVTPSAPLTPEETGTERVSNW